MKVIEHAEPLYISLVAEPVHPEWVITEVSDER